MPRFVVRPEGPAWDTLTGAVRQLASLVAAEEVDLNVLGASLAAVVGGARAVFVAAGLPSVRMDAAHKALDRQTPKSALESFVGR